MIVFDLVCHSVGHRFEGWFASSAAFDDQQKRGLVECPYCGSSEIDKAPMAPAVPRKGNQDSATAPPAITDTPISSEAMEAMRKLAAMQATMLKNSTWVGKDFANRSRAIHSGDADQQPIHGEATLAEAKELVDEGVPVMPLLFPVIPPDDVN